MQSKYPRISVIINFFNEEYFIQEAIESVLAQTYEDWELLLVDDGSTDGSTSIAKNYTARLELPGRVTYLEHEGHRNKGCSASRNLGIGHAKGELIAFLDADDVWFPDKLQKQTEALDRFPDAAMVLSPARVWYSWAGPSSSRSDYDVVPKYARDALVAPPEIVRAQLLDDGNGPCPPGMLIRRAVAQDVGGFEADFPGLYDDQVFFSKLCLTHPVYVMRDPVFKYRTHPNSLCQAATSGEKTRARQQFLQWLELYLDGRVAHDSAVWATLQNQLFPYRHPYFYRLGRNFYRLGRKTVRVAAHAARLVLPSSVYRWARASFRRSGDD